MSRVADYEGRVLKSVYLYPDKLLLPVINALTADDFTGADYRKFFTLLDDYAKEHRTPTRSTLIDFISDRDFDAQLVSNNFITNYYHYPEELKDPIKQIRNRTALAKINTLAKDWTEYSDKITSSAEMLTTKIYEDVAKIKNMEISDYDGKSIAERTQKYLERMRKQGYGWTTGLEALDFITYGMQPQRMWLIGGYTSVGKSWVGIHLSKKLIQQGVKVLIITMEMSAEDVFIRLTSSYLDRPDITISDITSKNDEVKIAEYDKVVAELREKPLYIVDNLYTWDQVSATIRYYVHAFGVQAVFLDYVQNITTSKSSEYEGLNIICREFQRMAVELNIFCVAFSQINRESARSEDNQVFGFKGSGNLENAADVAMTLRKVDDPKYRNLVVGKNRHGDIAEIRLYVNYNYGAISQAPTPGQPTEAEKKELKEYGLL